MGNNKEKDKTQGISFARLMPFLSMEFKQKLANCELEVKDYFNLHSNNAYINFLTIIRDDVVKNGGKVNIFPDKPKQNSSQGLKSKIKSVFNKSLTN